MRWIKITGMVMASMLLTTCGGGSGDASGTGDTDMTVGVEGPTYHEHVAKILNENCVTCHRTGGIAPFSLDGLTAVLASGNGSHLSRVTADRSMPPYLADNSGSCNTFEDARWLSNGDIETIGNWIDTGMPTGVEPATPLEPPVLAALAADEIDATAMMSAAYTPTGSESHQEDDYRCFVVDPGITTNQFLTAYEVKPDNDELVHHVILYGLKSDLAESAAATLAANETSAGPGYTCFGGSGVLDDDFDHVVFLAAWAPGTGVTKFPVNTGIPLAANRKMVMQVHYNMAGGRSGADQSSIYLKLASSVTDPASVLPIADLDMSIPAGQTDVSTSINSGPLPPGIQVHGVFPHMHTLGRKIRVDQKMTGGGSSCVIDVPEWSFEWQQFFFFSQGNRPIVTNAGDSFELTCTYDTRSRPGPDPITWGDGTQDEMCVNFFYTTGLNI